MDHHQFKTYYMKKSEENSLFNDDFGEKEWIGEVVENIDPLHELRCKIRVYSLFDDLPIDKIPWSFPSSSMQFAGSSGGYGACSVPRIGTIVKVRFSNGNLYAPEYFAIQNINPELQKEIANDYVNAQVLCYDVDEKLKVYYTKGKGLYINLKDVVINVTNTQDILINNPAGNTVTLTAEGVLTISTKKDINVNTDTNINLKCKNATIDASDSISLGSDATEAVINGDVFQKYINNHKHISAAPGSLTTPPIIPSTPDHLSTLASVKPKK